MRIRLLLALSLIQMGSIQARKVPLIKWRVASCMVKVRPLDSDPAAAPKSAALYAARNEFESFQIVLNARQSLTGVDIDISDFASVHGETISKNHATVYAEPYIELSRPSGIGGGTGAWPDPLIPRTDRYTGEQRNYFPLGLQQDRNHTIWVEIHVPPGTQPGQYHGSARVLLGNVVQFTVPIEITVWAFSLPSTASLKSSYGLSGPSLLKQHRGRYTSDQDLYAITRLYARAALMHRISIHGGSMAPPKVQSDGLRLDVDWRSYDAEVGPFLDGTAVGPGEPLAGARATSVDVRIPGGSQSQEQRVQYLSEWLRHFRQRGWIDRLFLYLWDEPRQEDSQALVDRGRAALRAAPELRTLVTTPFNPNIRDVVRIWVPLVNCLERRPGFDDYCAATPPYSSYAPELAGGKKLWFYQSCASHGCNGGGGAYFTGWPSYVIDAPATANRVMQWVAWKRDIEGELYYSMNQAYADRDPWNDIRASGGNGDGTLFYPGKPDRIGGATDIPIESIRLKLIREGMEDYEYLVLAAKLGGEELARGFGSRIVREAYQWESRPEVFLNVRQELGRTLDRLARMRPANRSDAH